MDIKRRGFMTGLGAFFGLGAAESISGDVADAQLDGAVDEKPKPAVAPGSQVVSCRPGDIIELQLGNIRTRARVEQYEIECIPQGIDISSTRGHRFLFLERPPRITIALRLRSVSDPMVMDVTVD